jgi:SAM-dependent methyltransferase
VRAAPIAPRLLRAPAVKALLIQLGALLPTVAIAIALDALGAETTILTAALIQGLLAMLITWKLGLARWWRPIQLLFPLAVLAASALRLPPVLYLVVFLGLLAVYWSTFRTQVPYYPSNEAVWRAVEELLPRERELKVIDIGSGLGGMAMHLAAARPRADVTGIELAPLPWLVSRLRAAMAGNRARFVRGDYERLDFGAYDLVFAYLSPAAMPGLWDKARREMRAGSLLVSYEFEIPAGQSVKTILTTEGGPLLYYWQF